MPIDLDPKSILDALGVKTIYYTSVASKSNPYHHIGQFDSPDTQREDSNNRFTRRAMKKVLRIEEKLKRQGKQT